MAPATQVGSRSMAPRGDIDLKRRARLRLWLWYYLRRRKWTNTKLAESLEVSEPTVTNILNERTNVGFDVFIKMHDNLKRSADDLLDMDPPPLPPDEEH